VKSLRPFSDAGDQARSYCRAIRRFEQDVRGLAGIEFALIAGLLFVSVLNVTDIAVYLYDQMEVYNATQMGSQAAWKACDLNHSPATVKCPGLNSAVTTAVQATSLGSSVTLQTGSPSEGYYCVNSTGTLQMMSSVSSPPSDCSAAGNGGTAPADYLEVQTTYSYVPMFQIAITALLPSTITSTSWVRMAGQ
jgi:Flp pilus assembly protein TadG